MIRSTAVRALLLILSGAWFGSDLPATAAGLQDQEAPVPGVPVPAAPTQADRERQVSALAAVLLAALKAGGTQTAQIEAQLSLLIGQAQSGCGDSKSALTQAAGQAGALSDAAKVALKNISGALERCETEGTGALADAQSVLQQGTTLGLSGGSSNYTPPQTATTGGGGA